MSSIENSLNKILADAEAAVLKVLADAAGAGNYAAIDRARTLAERLRDLGQGVNRRMGIAESAARLDEPGTRKRTRRAKPRGKKNYPKYEFKNGSLFKIGWSKKKKNEYIHRVPTAVVHLVSKVLQGFSETSDPVSSEQIIEADGIKGAVPSYQVYIILAFLKDRGIITGVGREGFQLPLEIASQVDELVDKEVGRF